MSDVTRILGEIEAGDPQAASRLLPLIYDELRKLAAQKMASERKDHTLQGTALVHEAYLRLVDSAENEGWDSRGHFFSAAAEAMRRILIEQARRKAGPHAGGDLRRIELSGVNFEMAEPNWDLLALNEAIDELEAHDPRAARLVTLRFFAGLTRQEAADALGISVATADNDWAYAKGWLQVALSNGSAPEA
jgi:RNA polymerase sigma factor (TIGR02999 family)